MKVKNPISRIIPSYIVPTESIDIDGLIISQNGPVRVNDDWGRDYFSNSLKVFEDDVLGRTDRWIKFHSLLAFSRLPLYSFHAYGHSTGDFQVLKLDKTKYPNVDARTIEFEPDDCLNAVYLSSDDLPYMSYNDIFEEYKKQPEEYKSAIESYFIAQDLQFNSRLRHMNKSFWAIVMLVSSLEALLPKPTFCEGEECSICGNKNRHVVNNVGEEWNELLFDRIKQKEIKKQYREILDTARYKIRNDTVHNGLTPPSLFSRASLEDGINLYTTEKIMKSYLEDSNSLEGFIDQLTELCRYLLLNQIVGKDIFPKLKPLEIYSKTIRNITSPSYTFDLSVPKKANIVND